jgi:hypothetical protein
VGSDRWSLRVGRRPIRTRRYRLPGHEECSLGRVQYSTWRRLCSGWGIIPPAALPAGVFIAALMVVLLSSCSRASSNLTLIWNYYPVQKNCNCYGDKSKYGTRMLVFVLPLYFDQWWISITLMLDIFLPMLETTLRWGHGALIVLHCIISDGSPAIRYMFMF